MGTICADFFQLEPELKQIISAPQQCGQPFAIPLKTMKFKLKIEKQLIVSDSFKNSQMLIS
jgi:hypothetical protein